MSLHLNLQCQIADKNTDTRITSLAEGLEHLVVCDLSNQTVWPFAAVTPLYGHPTRPSNTFLHICGNFRRSRVLRPRDAYSRLSERWQTAPGFGRQLDPSLTL